MSILPENSSVFGFIFLERKLRSVVFPAPLPPIIAKASPVLTDPDISDKIFFLTKSFFEKQPEGFFVEIVKLSHLNS
jgi:hypothetical protein